MTAKKLTPQTPGQAPDKAQMPPQQEEVIAKESTVASAGSDDDKITLSRSELNDLIDQRVEVGVAAGVKAARRRAELAQQPKAEDLPDQSEIDSSKIDRAVLTKQGYVCPRVHPSDRNFVNSNNNIR